MKVVNVLVLLATTCFRFLATPVIASEHNNNNNDEFRGDGETKRVLGRTPQTRVVGGNNADPSRYPYFVALVGPGATSVICGGMYVYVYGV